MLRFKAACLNGMLALAKQSPGPELLAVCPRAVLKPSAAALRGEVQSPHVQHLPSFPAYPLHPLLLGERREEQVHISLPADMLGAVTSNTTHTL